MRGPANLSATLILTLSMMTSADAAYPYRLNEQYEIGDGFMRVRLLGAVELPYEQIADQPLVELSGLAWDNDDEVLYALSDHGVLFHLTPVFAAGALVDAKVTHAFPLPGSDGKRLRGRSTDSEGLAILDGRNGIKGDAVLLISFEREPRVNRYSPVGNFVERHDLPQSLRQAYRGSNNGFESVAFVEALGILTAPQRPIEDPYGKVHIIFDLMGSTWSFPRFEAPATSLVAIEAMPDGSLLTLERSFVSVWQPLQIVLRQSAPLPAPPGGTLATQEIAVFNSFDGWRVDNFEGMTRHRDNKIFLISDDNANGLQRTLLIYLEILDKPVTKIPTPSGK